MNAFAERQIQVLVVADSAVVRQMISTNLTEQGAETIVEAVRTAAESNALNIKLMALKSATDKSECSAQNTHPIAVSKTTGEVTDIGTSTGGIYAQDEAFCEVFGMPGEVIKRDGTEHIISLEHVPAAIIENSLY